MKLYLQLIAKKIQEKIPTIDVLKDLIIKYNLKNS